MSINDDLGPLPREHDRVAAVRLAAIELASFLLDLITNHDLTTSELFYVLIAFLNQHALVCVVSERREAEQEKIERGGATG